MAVKFVNTTREKFLEKLSLYKYISLENAIKSINDSTLWFANPTTWNDPYEARFYDVKYQRGKTKFDFPLKGRVLCTCITTNPTNEAQWLVYSNNKDNVQLKLKADVLLQDLDEFEDYDVYISKIKYLPQEKLKKQNISQILGQRWAGVKMTDLQCIKLMSLKRNYFAYEKEYRIFIVAKGQIIEEGNKGDAFQFNNFKAMINRVLCSPKITKKGHQKIKICYEGAGIPVHQSHLYDDMKHKLIKL